MDKLPGEELIKVGIEKVGEPLYKDAVQPAAQAGGHALGTLMNVFNLLFAPLERANMRSQAKTERLRRELEKGYEEIPEKQRVEPPLEVVGPALESMKYVEDEKLQKMFIELLLASMDSERQGRSHRAFVKILEEINSLEAKMVRAIAEEEFAIYARIKTTVIIYDIEFLVPLHRMHEISGLTDSLGGTLDGQIYQKIRQEFEEFAFCLIEHDREQQRDREREQLL